MIDIGCSESTEMLKMHPATSEAPVVLVGKRMWELPLSSTGRGPMWSKCRLSNGLQDAQNRLITWQHWHWRMNWVIVRSVIVGSLRNSLHFRKPQWPTMELCTAAICLKTATGMQCFGPKEAKKA